MKYIALSFLVFLAFCAGCVLGRSIMFGGCACSQEDEITAKSKYEILLMHCDAEAEKCMVDILGLNECLDKQIDCYVKIIHKIYDKYYSIDVQQYKKDLSEFIEISGRLHYTSYQPDYCQPACGTIGSSSSRIDVLEDLKRYINNTVLSLPSDEELKQQEDYETFSG